MVKVSIISEYGEGVFEWASDGTDKSDHHTNIMVRMDKSEHKTNVMVRIDKPADQKHTGLKL